MARMLYEPIYAHGYWHEDRWHINYSSIMTALIQIAGTYVDFYASDLLHTWNYKIEKHFSDPEWKGNTIYIGFREMGVDDYEEGNDYNCIEMNKKENGHYYYRRIVKLETMIVKDEITMQLSHIQ